MYKAIVNINIMSGMSLLQAFSGNYSPPIQRLGVSPIAPKPKEPVGTTDEEEKIVIREVKPVYSPTPVQEEDDEKYYRIELQISQQDCHLICLFLGVFTLSMLINNMKRNNN